MARNGKRKTVEVDAATYQSLDALRIATNTKSLGAMLAQLIPLHPNCESETADPDADDLSDYDYDQTQVEVAETAGRASLSKEEATKIAVVSRLVVEGSVSLNKLPLVIDLVKLLLSVSDNETLSTSTYDRLFKKAFSYDVALLKSFFEGASSVHLKPDCSTRQGQERLSVFLTGWLNEEPVEKLIFSGAIDSKTGEDQFTSLLEVLQQLDVLDRIIALTSDQGKDVCAPNGLFGLLEKHLKRELLRIMCDLHILNRGFVVAGERTFGKPKMNEPSVFQLLYLVPAALKPWAKWKPLLAEHLALSDNDSLTLCPDSINTRWYTVVEAANFTDKRANGLIALGFEYYFQGKSSHAMQRKLWQMINIWLSNPILRSQVAILVDFGDFFYLPEMKWDQETGFRCQEMPARWNFRIMQLEQARQDPTSVFSTTNQRLDELNCSNTERTRIWADVEKFVGSLLEYYRPIRDRWLSFPYILFALGDPNVDTARRVAKQMVLSREQKLRTETDGLCAGILELHLQTHAIFEGELYQALKAFGPGSRPIAAVTCRPLKTWLEYNVRCVSHQNLTVESSFNMMTRLIQDGGGSRGLYTQEGAQAHLQNMCLPDHERDGKKYKYTTVHREQILAGVHKYVQSIRSIQPILGGVPHCCCSVAAQSSKAA